MQTNQKAGENKFRERLEIAMDRKGIPEMQKGRIVTLAKLVNTSQLTIRRWLDDERPTLPNTATLIALSQTLGVTVDFLLGIDHEIPLHPYEVDEETHIKLAECEVVNGRLVQGRNSYIHRESKWFAKGAEFLSFKIESDAMFPALQIGDLAIVEVVDKVVENKIYALFYEGRVIFRRIIPVKNSGVSILADNKHYPAIEFSADEFVLKSASSMNDVLPERGLLVVIGRVLTSVKMFN